MSNDRFPKLAGLDWHVAVSPERSSLKQPAATPGYETVLSLGSDPILHFECNYEFLREGILNTKFNELHRLMDFFSAHGDFESFLLSLPDLTQNPDDGAVTGQLLTADANGYAPLVVKRDRWTENIYELARKHDGTVTTPELQMNDEPLIACADYTIQLGAAAPGISYPGLVAVITKAIPAGAVITANFGWCYRVRFEQGRQDFKLFSHMLWETQQLQMVVRRSA